MGAGAALSAMHGAKFSPIMKWSGRLKGASGRLAKFMAGGGWADISVSAGGGRLIMLEPDSYNPGDKGKKLSSGGPHV